MWRILLNYIKYKLVGIFEDYKSGLNKLIEDLTTNSDIFHNLFDKFIEDDTEWYLSNGDYFYQFFEK